MKAKLTSPPMRVVARVDGEFTMYAWQAVRVVVWDGKVSVTGMRQLDGAMPVLNSVDSPFSLVHLVHGRTPLPSAEVRAEFERLTKSNERELVCTAVLDDREGFIAGAIKAVITGVSLIARVRLEIRLFTDVAELASWLVSTHRNRTGRQLDATELEAVVRAARDAHR